MSDFNKSHHDSRLKDLSGIFICLTALIFLTLSPLPLKAEQIDEAYTAKIKEYTTEPFFLTKYVDHLPAAKGIPTPLDILGRIAGAPDRLSYSHEVYTYMKALAEASPRVSLLNIGKTEEGRDMIVVVVSDESTIRDLDHYKKINASLADPRTIQNEEEAAQLIAESKPIYWATGALHSGETGSPEMLMELAYRIAAGESEFIRTIRNKIIVMITPILDVDGRDKVVDVYMAPKKDPKANVPNRPAYWGKYVLHDNNRDAVGIGLNLTQNILKTYFEFHPQVIHDLHESVAYLYISTGTGPYNAWVDSILIDELHQLAYQEVSEMTRLGVPGVWTHGFYDGWAPNYLFFLASSHNSIGRFYETQTAGNGSTGIIRSSDSRAWYRPNPPLRETVWSLRNNVNMQQSGILIAMNHVANNKKRFMENFYLKGKRSINKAKAEGPAAYIFPAAISNPAQTADLLRLLQRHGIEIHRALSDFKTKEGEFGSGSFIVRMDQPYSRAADNLLDRQYFNVDDPRPYDDVGWTLGPLFNTETVRIEDLAVLDAPMTKIDGELRIQGGVSKNDDGAVKAYLINHDASGSLATFRFAFPKLKMEAAEKGFQMGNESFNAGTFIIRVEGNPKDLNEQLQKAGETYEFTAWAVNGVPDVPSHLLEAPRIAVMHTWMTTQSEGWLRMGLDKLHIPYEYISVHDVRDTKILRKKYDVIIFGPSSNDAFQIVDGFPMTGAPMPWKKTALTPNIGTQDETDDMRGGLGLDGVFNLYAFIKGGGLLITLANSSCLPAQFGFAGSIRIKETPDLWARGGVYQAVVTDAKSPIVYGYGKKIGVYFNTFPVFGYGSSRSQQARIAPEAGDTTTRISGRGDNADKDRVQGRAVNPSEGTIKAFREAHKKDPAPAKKRTRETSTPTLRTILRFESNVKELLISGGLQNGKALAGTPAVVDSLVGEGHVVMFAINPFWRNQTRGSYCLLLNAVMNYNHLH
ncbi:MAG: hypothetical protein MUP70_01885 [Candidatus Aminicenantes bacterium]|nr:hypothetical protein [Candidatus Aminicenantes bacterium]